MKCRLECKIRVSIDNQSAETIVATQYEFQAKDETDAKRKATAYANTIPVLKDMRALIYEGELPDWWTPQSVRWEKWNHGRRETYEKDPTRDYVEFQRYSQAEYYRQTEAGSSKRVYAALRVAWLKASTNLAN